MSIIAQPQFHKYIDLVKADSVLDALLKNSKLFNDFLEQIPVNKTDYAYAEGKWTVKQVLRHIIDAERVFSYRALHFARKDAQPLPGFDENAWAVAAGVPAYSWDNLTAEFYHLRKSTELLFASFDEEALEATGTANNNQVNVMALGYMCAGHVQHHVQVMAERYFS